MPRFLQVFAHYFKAMAPAVLIVWGAAFPFREAVVASILSTPHPELVYVIFGGLALGLGFTWWALFWFVREESLLLRWQALPPVERDALLDKTAWHMAIAPLYRLLSVNNRMPERMRQSAVDHELEDLEAHMDGQLAMPTFIGGALIGLGLVGTFVGLLGTLAELGDLFASLMNSSSSSMSSAEMFSDMLRRLQAPIKGMGTAFVASLYGLLGSLLLGMAVIVVRRMGADMVARVRETVRDQNYGAADSLASEAAALAAPSAEEARRWQAHFEDMQSRYDSLMQTTHSMAQGTRELAQGAQVTNEAIQAHMALTGASHWMEAWDQMHAQVRHLRQESSQHQSEHSLQIQQHGQLLTTLVAVSQRQEALLADLAQRVAQQQSSLEHHSMALSQSLQNCQASFEEAASKLRLALSLPPSR